MKSKTALWVLLIWGCLSLLATAPSAQGASVSTEEGDEDLDELISEFLEDTKKGLEKKPFSGSDEDNKIQALNAQSKYLKKETCNCTKFFMCDVEETEESEEESIEGADIGIINIRHNIAPKAPKVPNISIRLNVPKGACHHYLDLCCEKLKPQIPMPPKTPTRNTKRTCGKRNVGGVGFTIVDSDSEAQFGEFPWMVAITEQTIPRYPDEKAPQKFVCGGSLIHPRVIMTAAHCLQNKSARVLRVRLGEWDTQTTAELYPHQDSNVESIILHEAYDAKKYLKNDIALAILKDDAEFAPHISPICIPPAGTNLDGARCFASGWGKNEYGQEGSYQAILKKVELPIVPRSSCQTTLRGTRLKSKFRLDESFICAGGEPKKDTCKGDGGSPLVCQLPGSDYFVQYGIVSWGLGCGSSIPAVYVNVPKFTPWIERKIEDAGLDTKYFQPYNINF